MTDTSHEDLHVFLSAEETGSFSSLLAVSSSSSSLSHLLFLLNVYFHKIDIFDSTSCKVGVVFNKY